MNTTTTNNSNKTTTARTPRIRKAKAQPEVTEVIEVTAEPTIENARTYDVPAPTEQVSESIIAQIGSKPETDDEPVADSDAEDIQLQADIQKVRDLIIRLKIDDKVAVQLIAPETQTSTGAKDEYVVLLSNGESITFKSADEKAAKYRAYRIAKDGSKTRPAGLKVSKLTNHENVEVK